MSNQSNRNDNNAECGRKFPPICLPGETMQQSFDRIEREAQQLGVRPDNLLEYSTTRLWPNSAAHPPDRLHLRSDGQANNSTAFIEITYNPQYRSGTSSGRHFSSGQQASNGSGAARSNGDASRQSNARAQNDNSSWNTASPHAQNPRTSAWTVRDQSGGANSQSNGRGGHHQGERLVLILAEMEQRNCREVNDDMILSPRDQ
ncbi:hypothetical protein EAE96_009866 [Botrytis aclada]|nr:hypothetical protein EAE96_009866 [Botrytis aclada]